MRCHGGHLRHRIFFTLSGTVVIAVVIAGFVVHSAASNPAQWVGLRNFANERFVAVWEDPRARTELADSVARHFQIQLSLSDAQGRSLYGDVSTCARRTQRLEIVREGQRIGWVEGCMSVRYWPKSVSYGLLSLMVLLWIMSGLVARALVRPFRGLARVVRQIGDGRLDARVELCRHHHYYEVGEMVDAINQMAEKIERQIAGQRELLAAVSHEIRSPLARLRVLCELAREESGVDAARLDAMDVELSELDTLVGQLLAHSRLEFQSLERKTLTAREVARTVLERASMPTTLLRDESEGATVSVDMSLFSRAMLNLVDNAQRHGGGLEVLLLRRSGERVVFEFCDHGPGFDEQTLHRAFVPFAGKNAGAGLGLGLSLVERIVRAHGGQVKLGNAVEGGARVTVETPVETSAARK